MRAITIVAIGLFLFSGHVSGQEQQMSEDEAFLSQLGWIVGPGAVDIGSQAEIDIPDGYDFLNPDDTTSLMEWMQNPGSVNEFYFAPADMRWFSVFSYEDTGYIEDDDELDADSILGSIREGTEYANEERRQRGWPELNIVGWQYEPFYEPDSNRLAWAILAESESGQTVNYNTRLLGRTGVMSVTLVADPATLDTAVEEFRTALAGFNYQSGQRYADYEPGDKTAAYGLAALVAGGAAAAAVKSGAGKGLFKAILVGGAAVLAALGGVFKRLFGKKG